jgi:hypothetical protein
VGFERELPSGQLREEFCLHSEECEEQSTLSNSTMAIYRRSDYGPTFGGEYDICLADECNATSNS